MGLEQPIFNYGFRFPEILSVSSCGLIHYNTAGIFLIHIFSSYKTADFPVYKSLKITGYRRFPSFKLENFGRVNLLVGTNSSGKTSILDCLELLQSTNNPYVLSAILRRRGEWDFPVEDNKYPVINLEHLFYDRNFDVNITIESDEEKDTDVNRNNKVEISVEDKSRTILPEEDTEFPDMDGDLVVSISWSDVGKPLRFGISREGYMSGPRTAFRPRPDSHAPVQFIQTNGMSSYDITRLFENIVLTDSEEHVIDALRIIEPSIDRIAALSFGSRSFSRERPSGIFIKRTDTAQRIPIGSAGDGMWRMLGLALAIAGARGGIVLIDEIDTGLHYSVMKKMWEMVSERSLALGTQVFATTHSRDCYESLASIVRSDSLHTGVAIHRIEHGLECAVTFSDEEVVVAAQRGLEIR